MLIRHPGTFARAKSAALETADAAAGSVEEAADAADLAVRVVAAEGGPGRSSTSSAAGYGQFLRTTWLDVFGRVEKPLREDRRDDRRQNYDGDECRILRAVDVVMRQTVETRDRSKRQSGRHHQRDITGVLGRVPEDSRRRPHRDDFRPDLHDEERGDNSNPKPCGAQRYERARFEKIERREETHRQRAQSPRNLGPAQ